MNLREFFGIQLAVCDVDEALATDWAGAGPDVDVIRVMEPPESAWPALWAAGFLPKPNRATWLAPTGRDDEEFRARLSGKDRQNLRTAERRAAAAGIRLSPATRLSPALLAAFLSLYERQVQRMRYGFPAAVQQRDEILADPGYFAVFASHADGVLAGACLCHELPAERVVRVRFSAVHNEGRDSSLARVLYARAVTVARELGYPRITLGHDPNLYGHIPKPGLFSFKLRLGFSPVPPHHCVADDRMDQADRVLRLSALTDPALIVAYAPGAEPSDSAVALAVLSSAPEPDLRMFTHALAPPMLVRAVPHRA